MLIFDNLKPRNQQKALRNSLYPNYCKIYVDSKLGCGYSIIEVVVPVHYRIR